jgi:hypothetical protein
VQVLVVAVLGGVILWVSLGAAWEVLCPCGFWVFWIPSLLFVLFSFLWRFLVYFLCIRIVPLCAFDIYNITYKRKIYLAILLAAAYFHQSCGIYLAIYLSQKYVWIAGL